MKGAIFDMDGVLVDNLDVHFRAFELFCDRYGIRDWRERLMAMCGMGNDDILRALFPAEVVERRGLRALGEEKEAIYREIYAPDIRPVDGLAELLGALKEAGIRCAVGSSGCKANVDFVMERCALAPYFPVRIDGDRVTRCKPDPEIYLTAARELGIDPSECLVFEDSLAGMRAARAAGAKVVALATSLPRTELEAKSGADLILDNYVGLTVARLQAL